MFSHAFKLCYRTTYKSNTPVAGNSFTTGTYQENVFNNSDFR